MAYVFLLLAALNTWVAFMPPFDFLSMLNIGMAVWMFMLFLEHINQ